ncbi:MAG TPA: SIMPL domain-containing protein [Desulfobaccales bacterium]
MRRMLAKQLVLMALGWSCLVAVGHTAEPPTPGRTIAVEADGKVMAIPDLARLTLEVETQAPQAEAAAQENARRAEALVKALKQSLTPDDQVKTLGYRLSPVYAPKTKSGPPVIKAYQAVHRFQVKLKGPERLGAVIDLALKNGASGVNGPFWEHSRLEELQRQAAVAALKRARRLAEALAQSQGLKIKGVEKISTGLHYQPFRAGGEGMRMAPAAPATPIEVGEEEIRASVQVVFQLGP